MEIRPHRIIHRKKTKTIMVGKVPVGGDSVITVKSMTNTITSNVSATIKQIIDLEEAGADIIRVSCHDEASTFALKEIVKEVNVPIVADIHFHHNKDRKSIHNLDIHFHHIFHTFSLLYNLDNILFHISYNS